jgi:hypothetical protein
MGEFRIANLSPGRYYISCQPMNRMGRNEAPASPDKPDIRPVRTYYPDAIGRDAAAPLTVRVAQDMPGIDIHMRAVQTYHVRGKVAGNLPEGGADRLGLSLSPRDDFMPMFFPGGSNVGKDGAFDLAGLAPGAYTLSLVGMNGRMTGIARQAVDVGTADLNGVILAVVPPGMLRGAIHIEGRPEANAATADLSSFKIYFTSVDRSVLSNIPETIVKSDGAFTAENVGPAKYFVHVIGTLDGGYLRSIQFGRQEVFGKELDLSQGASGELNVFFRYGAAEVSGTVQPPEGTLPSPAAPPGQPVSAPSASLVLVPDVVNEDGSGMSFVNTDQNGAFKLKGLRPGHYRAYAFEHLDMNQWQNPAVRRQLEGRGADVELNENDKKQIQLTVVSGADLLQTLASLGIESQ